MGKRKGPSKEEKRAKLEDELNNAEIEIDLEPTPEVKAAQEGIEKSFLGVGLTEITSTDDNVEPLNIITQRYNIRPLVKGHWKAITASLVNGNIQNMKAPLVVGIRPGLIKNVDKLLKDFTENSRDVPIVVFGSSSEAFILLSGQHRFKAGGEAVTILKGRFKEHGVYRDKLQGKRDALAKKVEKDNDAVLDGKTLKEPAKVRSEMLMNLERMLARVESDMAKILRWITKIRLWPVMFYDLRKLMLEGEYPNQLPRLLSENEELKTMLKLVVERVADGVSNMVEYQGIQGRTKTLLSEFTSITDAAAKSILTHDQLRDTLFYAANVSDSFKYFELFQAKYLNGRILGKVHDNLIIYLIRDSVFTTQRIFEYHFGRHDLEWETVNKVDRALADSIKSKQPLEDELQQALLMIQRHSVVSDSQRLKYNAKQEKKGQLTIQRICDMGLLTQGMLVEIDKLFVAHLQDAAGEMGWDTPRWSKALDAYALAVGDYLDELEADREELEDEPSPERLIQRAAGSMVRVLYAKTSSNCRPLPLPTTSMLHAVAKLGEKFGLSIAEIARWLDALANYVVHSTGNTKVKLGEDKNPRTYSAVISESIRRQSKASKVVKNVSIETCVLPLFWRLFQSYTNPGLQALQTAILHAPLASPIPSADIFGKFFGAHKMFTPMYTNFKAIWDLNRSFHPARASKIKTADGRPPPQTIYHRMFANCTWARPVDTGDDVTHAGKIAPWVFSQCSDGHYRADPSGNDAATHRRPANDRYPDYYDGCTEWFGPAAEYRRSLLKYTEVIEFRTDLGLILQMVLQQDEVTPYVFWDGLVLGEGVPFGNNNLSTELLFALSSQQEEDAEYLLAARGKMVNILANNLSDTPGMRVATAPINDGIDHVLTLYAINLDRRRITSLVRHHLPKEKKTHEPNAKLVEDTIAFIQSMPHMLLEIPQTRRRAVGITDECIVQGTAGSSSDPVKPSLLPNIPKRLGVLSFLPESSKDTTDSAAAKSSGAQASNSPPPNPPTPKAPASKTVEPDPPVPPATPDISQSQPDAPAPLFNPSPPSPDPTPRSSTLTPPPPGQASKRKRNAFDLDSPPPPMTTKKHPSALQVGMGVESSESEDDPMNMGTGDDSENNEDDESNLDMDMDLFGENDDSDEEEIKLPDSDGSNPGEIPTLLNETRPLDDVGPTALLTVQLSQLKPPSTAKSMTFGSVSGLLAPRIRPAKATVSEGKKTSRSADSDMEVPDSDVDPFANDRDESGLILVPDQVSDLDDDEKEYSTPQPASPARGNESAEVNNVLEAFDEQDMMDVDNDVDNEEVGSPEASVTRPLSHSPRSIEAEELPRKKPRKNTVKPAPVRRAGSRIASVASSQASSSRHPSAQGGTPRSRKFITDPKDMDQSKIIRQ